MTISFSSAKIEHVEYTIIPPVLEFALTQSIAVRSNCR